MNKTYFFCGIGGIGMSSIALYLKKLGATVKGSDRAFDMGRSKEIKAGLLKAGIELFPQDGSGVTKDIDLFVVTRAVEPTVPEIKKALDLGLKIRKRPEMLADIFHTYQGIAVAGTCGKTSVTAMVNHILYKTGKDPVMINGGISLNTYHGDPKSNLNFGKGDICVIEADESDKSLELYTPTVAVVNNLSLDHHSIEENAKLFEEFLFRATKGCVVGKDCPELKRVQIPTNVPVKFWSLKDKTADFYADKITIRPGETTARINGITCTLPFMGAYNIGNALSALAACSFFGISIKEGIKALKSFKGTKRRMQKLGSVGGVTVYDDYAHNPEKIRAALASLKSLPGRIFAVYQPHGFISSRFMKDEIIKMLNDVLDDKTYIFMSDIYAAGGPIPDDIHTMTFINAVKNPLKKTHLKYFSHRPDIIPEIVKNTKKGDIVLVMGARDETLTYLGKEIVKTLKKEEQ